MLTIIELTTPIRFAFVEQASEVVQLGWHHTPHGEWVGFYDVLRDAERRPVGLRLWPFENVAPLFEACQSDRAFINGKSVCFMFGSSNSWEEPLSSDQMMEHASVLENANKFRALLLSLSPLVKEEQSEIVAAVAADGPPEGLKRK